MTFLTLGLPGEKSIKGVRMGSGRAALDIPRFVDLFMQGRLPINKLVSKRYTPGEVNDAFDLLEKDEIIKPIIVF